MKDSIDSIEKNGNSSTLYELANRMGNATESIDANPIQSEPGNQPCSRGAEISTANAASMDIHPSILQINTLKDFFKMNEMVTAIEMKSGLCNDSQILEWDLSVSLKLTELVVGDNCLQFVRELRLNAFKCLEKVAIGMRCCCSSESGCFEVSGCGVLRSVKLGDGCCVNWKSFVMRNCDSIQEVNIGDGCFVNCENTVFESERSVIR